MLDPRLVETLSRILNVAASSVSPTTSPSTVSSWDSVAHINLILELEDVFGVRFPTEAIPKLDSAARLQEEIDALRGSAQPGR
jgi:acyl carrier protein